jgi:hypothetical protein
MIVNQTFEELAQRFDQLQFHVLEKPTDIVVRFYGGTRALEADALDDVRIKGTFRADTLASSCRTSEMTETLQ